MKWEYRSIQFMRNLCDERLNGLGEMGWELVAVTESNGWYSAVFKRPKQ
jgi:hypothetical protein